MNSKRDSLDEIYTFKKCSYEFFTNNLSFRGRQFSFLSKKEN